MKNPKPAGPRALTALMAATAVLGAFAGTGASVADAAHHKAKKHRVAAKCKAGHKDLDRDAKDKHCPDDRDGSRV